MLTVYWCGKGGTLEKGIPLSQVPERLRRTEGVLWIDVESPHEDDIRFLGETFGFHPLTLKACAQRTRRATMECFDAFTFMIARAVEWPETAKRFTSAQLTIFIGSRYLVTCHERNVYCIQDAVEKLEKFPEQVVSAGADFVLCEVFEFMASRTMRALDRLELEIERVEEQILSGKQDNRQDMANISHMRWNVLHLRRTVSPLRDAINALARGDSPHISGRARIYFRNVYDHMLRVTEGLDTYREVVTDLRDTHLAMVSNRMNEVIKVLTVITTILLPLTVISGIYGMNFDVMPELRWRFGYFAVLAVMLLLTVVTAILLKRKKWM